MWARYKERMDIKPNGVIAHSIERFLTAVGQMTHDLVGSLATLRSLKE